MKKTCKISLICFLAIGFLAVGFGLPGTPGVDGTVSVAEAHHRPGHGGGPKDGKWCRKHPDRCKPPTVSELPVHYMVASGIAAILITGGIVYQLRRREEENASSL